MRNTLGTALGTSLPATLLFDYPTIDALTDHLYREILGESDGESDAAATATAAAPAAGVLVQSIEDMSDDEVDRLLASRSKRK